MGNTERKIYFMSERLKEVLKERKMTVLELSEQTGISIYTLRKALTQGIIMPDILNKISLHLIISQDYLTGKTDNKNASINIPFDQKKYNLAVRMTIENFKAYLLQQGYVDYSIASKLDYDFFKSLFEKTDNLIEKEIKKHLKQKG